MLVHMHMFNFQVCEFFLQMSNSVQEVIILLDNESVELPYCQCDVQAPLCIVQALPAVARQFRDTAMAVVLYTPPDAAVEDVQVAQAMYMHAWHAMKRKAHIRACAHAYASPRRSPRLVESRV